MYVDFDKKARNITILWTLTFLSFTALSLYMENWAPIGGLCFGYVSAETIRHYFKYVVGYNKKNKDIEH